MNKFFLSLIIALALSACAYPKREKANLAIDDSVEPAPARETDKTDATYTSTDEPVPKGDIELGLDGSSGPLVVEGALSDKEQEEALAEEEEEEEAATDKSKKKDKKVETDDDDE